MLKMVDQVAHAGGNPSRIGRFWARRTSALQGGADTAAAEKSRRRAQPAQDPSGRWYREGGLGYPARSRITQSVFVAVRRRATHSAQLEAQRARAGAEPRIGCDERSLAARGLLIRGNDNLLCVHASSRHGERPPDDVLSLEASAPQASLTL